MVLIVTVFIGMEFIRKSNWINSSYGVEPAELLKNISDDTIIKENVITVSSDILNKLNKENSWLQILNEEGKEIYSFHKPELIQSSYAPGELVSYRKVGNISGYKIYTWFKEINSEKLTWIYGAMNHDNIMDDFRIWVGIAVLCIVFLFAVALHFGVLLGKPVFYILKWVENISKGNYQEPHSESGEPIFRDHANNQLHRTYKDYEELIFAIESLCHSLKENEINRKQLEKSREEWIAGVSHDMKTPLSSVKGYASLLASEQYTFNQEETMMYARIICDKATYMEDLIEDLNLTFAISNNALPINLQTKNLVELVRRAVIDLINGGTTNQVNINFLNQEDEKILYPIDEKWFKRAIDNLLYNSISHNKDKITITIEINQESNEQMIAPVMIKISDNGKGMTKEQLNHIFERYYRGTNTSEEKVKGSGLGTAIAKQLIEANGGHITVESEINKGTTFIIHLPGNN